MRAGVRACVRCIVYVIVILCMCVCVHSLLPKFMPFVLYYRCDFREKFHFGINKDKNKKLDNKYKRNCFQENPGFLITF